MLWREHDWPNLRIDVAQDVNAQRLLAQWGLLKFPKNDLLRSQNRLLCFLVRSWNRRHKVMVLQGKDIPICPKMDIYFVTGLLTHGEALPHPFPLGKVAL